MMILTANENDHAELIEIWESSVRATHDFLPSSAIDELKPLILNQYFQHVRLDKYMINDKILGFLGTSSDNIEMLFIRPEARGKGIGRALIDFATTQLHIHKVDVNEQNPQAIGFYLKMGFQVVARSALDGQGQPYPLLHMQK